MEQRVIDFFHGSIEAKMSAGEALAAPIVEAAALLVERLLQDKKVLTCGNGLSATLAATLSQCLLHHYRFERPGFPSLCLSADMVLGTAVCREQGFRELFSRQIRTLAQPGDVLVIFGTGSDDANLAEAVQVAHDRDMTAIAFTAIGDWQISELLSGTDVELRVENDDQYRVQEIQLLALFCLCDLVEQQIFGGEC